jgi:DNA-binding CsgD family transcriptional regulator
MDAARRAAIIAAYDGHVRRFDEVTARTHGRAGGFPLRERVTHSQDEQNPVPGPLLNRLSAREQEVLALVAQGRSNQEVGASLCIAAETVKTHVRHILQRLGARNRAHAVFLAYLQAGTDPRRYANDGQALPLVHAAIRSGRGAELGLRSAVEANPRKPLSLTGRARYGS